jgi:hypothetical protein
MSDIKLDTAIKCSNCGCVTNVVKTLCPISETKGKQSYINICTKCFLKKCLSIFK